MAVAGVVDVDTEFWMPAAREPIAGVTYGLEGFTRREQAVLKRLAQGARPRKAARRLAVRKHRAFRNRRRALSQLAAGDVHSLVQIVLQLGL